MQLQLQDFTTLVRNQVAAVTASCRTLMDMSVGSVLRALLEANASVGLWMQWLIMEVLATTRAATSQAADLDSWVQDFGMSRLPAVPAVGAARFSRMTAGLPAVIPAGAIVRTGVGADAQSFAVAADSTRAEWNGIAYVIASTAVDLIVPIRAVVPGRAGNVQAGVLVLLSTAIPGVDSVINDYAASGGLDAETDAALRTRFAGFIDSRTRATAQAISFVVQSVQQGLQFIIAERVDSAGALRPGHFTVVVDDGSGAPSNTLLDTVAAAIETVRPVGGTYSVIKPQLLQINVSLQIIAPSNTIDIVQAAIGTFITKLPIGGDVITSKLVQIAHDSNPAVARVGNVMVNGVAGDFPVPAFGRAIPGTITVIT